MQVNMLAINLPGWHFGGTTAELRIYSLNSFKSGNGVYVGGSYPHDKWYKSYTCTVNGTVLEVPQVVLDSTVNSGEPTAKFYAVLIDYRQKPRDFFISFAFGVPTNLGANVHWEDLRIWAKGNVAVLPSTYLTSDQCIALINNQLMNLTTNWSEARDWLKSNIDFTSWVKSRAGLPIFYYDDFALDGDSPTDDTALLVRAHQTPNCILRGNPNRTYIVKPSSPSSSAIIIPVLANQTVLNANIKIADNAGTYKAIFGSNSDVSGFTLKDCIIDHNQANNNIGAANAGQMISLGQRGSFYGGGNDLRFLGNVIKNSQCVNEFYIGIGGVLAKRATIRGNSFISCGNNPANFAFDSSQIYVSGDSCLISDNYFQGDWSAKAITAIETHCTKQVIKNNIVEGFQKGANITGVHAVDCELSIVSHNVFDVKVVGISFWSMTYGGHSSGFGLKDFVIQNNVINIRQATYANDVGSSATGGIGFELTNNLPLKNFLIEGNKISFEVENTDPLNAGASHSSGIMLRHSSNPLMECADITVSNNQIFNAPIAGIGLSAFINGLIIERNLLVNCGQGKIAGIPTAYKVPFFLDFKANKGRTTIRGNHIVDNFSVTRMQYCFTCFGVSGVNSPYFLDNSYDIQGDAVSFLRLFSIAATGSSFLTPFIRQVVNSWTAPSCDLKAGSQIFDISKGWTVFYEVDGTTKVSAKLASERKYLNVNNDADFNVDGLAQGRILHTATLTANRTATFLTSGLTADNAGLTLRVTRTGGGAFTLTVGGVGGTKALAQNQWADVTWHGSVWYVSAYGTL